MSQERLEQLAEEHDDRVERNLEQSVKLGWSPADFGAATFDSEMVRAVELFQEERMMDPTGVADWRTYKALLAYRSALAEASRDRQRRENLRGLGSVSRLPADHPRVLASSAFTGVGLYVDQAANPALVSRLVRGRRVTHLIVPRNRPDLPRMARLMARVGGRLSVAAATSYGMRSGLSRIPRDAAATGLVIVMPDERGVRQALMISKVQRALVELREVGLPIALVTPSYRPRRYLTGQDKKAWLSLLDLADVYMPRVPGDERGRAPEFYMGVCFAEWSIMLGRMPSAARWIFPMYQPVLGDANHAIRFRAYLRDREIRGHSFSKLPMDAGRGPYFGDLPSQIERVDEPYLRPK